MTLADVRTHLDDAQVLALTGAAEARAMLDPTRGWERAPLANMVAVMCTPINRVKADAHRFGATVTDACLAHEQYSCWTPGGSNDAWLLEQAAAVGAGKGIAPVVQQCLDAATKLLDGDLPDAVSGATHYYSPVSMVPPGRVPDWAVGKTPVATVGDHLFFLHV